MKNGKFRELLQQTLIKTGAIVIASALVLTSSYWSEIFRNDMEFIAEAELPVFTDPDEASVIEEEPTPFPPAPKITKTTKTNKTTKKVKLKEKSKKTYTKKSKTKKQTTTSKKVTGSETTTITTETSTNLTSKFTKGSNINTQITTVTTVTTTMVQEAAPDNEGVVVLDTASANTDSPSAPVQTVQNVTSVAQTASQVPASGQVSISSVAPRVDSRVASAYTKLGFTISINPNVNYSGVCDARNRSIVLKKSGDTVYHELGHFLAFVAGNVDKSSSFQQVFEQEKSKYTMYNKAYVLQNSSEYFAESFKNYTLDPNGLKSSRPLTYAAIESALNNVTDAQVTRVQTVYRSVWGA